MRTRDFEKLTLDEQMAVFHDRAISGVSLEHRQHEPHWAVRFNGDKDICGTGDTPAEAFADAWLGLDPQF